MTFKGTPGEWKNEGGDNSSIDIILPNETVISHSRYSRFTDRFVMEREEMEANMNLIAAAPELLEALQNLIQLKEWKDKHGKDEHYEKAKDKAWYDAKSAIDKALNYQP